MELEATAWRSAINALIEADKGDAECLHVIQERDEVLEIAAKPLEGP